LPEGHLAYFVMELVRELDLSTIESKIQDKDPRGTKPYSPRMMTMLLLYAYCIGVYSSRKIERATHENVAFRVIAGGEHPHFTRINEFRLEHRDALSAQFKNVLRLCQRAGLVSLGHVSLDGSKVQANASKHKAMSYGRMLEDEKRLAAEIEALIARADAVDAEEDQRLGPGSGLEDLPEELQRREARLARIREAKAKLEQEAAQTRAEQLLEQAEVQRQKAKDAEDPAERKRAATRARKSEERARALLADDEDGDGSSEDETNGASSAESDAASASPKAEGSVTNNTDDGDGSSSTSASTDDLPYHRVPSTPDGAPRPEAQRNFTDPDSRIMMKDGAYIQGYNTQSVVDDRAQIIVAHAVTNQAPDQEHLLPLMERTIANCGAVPEKLTADAGYFSQNNVQYCEERGLDPFISVQRKPVDGTQQPATSTTPAQQARQRMREKLASSPGRDVYARRKTITEPVFGQIKEARRFRRFSLRGLTKVRSEWGIICLCHNVLKLFAAIPTPARLIALAAE